MGLICGAAATVPKILSTLISAFGGLGLLSKFDRVIQALGLVAAKPKVPVPTASAVQGLTLLGELLKRLAERSTPLQTPTPMPTPAPFPVPTPGPVFTGRTKTLRGKMSHFGGPDDHGVSSSEGLALVEKSDLERFSDYFLPEQPPGTSGLARRLNPETACIACRWNYNEMSRSHLRSIKVQVTNPRTGQSEMAQPMDWGPNIRTGRVADLSPGLERRLGLVTDQECVVVIPLP